MANIIKIKRGLSTNLDNASLQQGELAITTDTQDLYVGTESGIKKVGGADLSGYAPIDNPNFTGSVSMGRFKNSTVGDYSTALGNGTTASGYASYAEGNNTTAGGYASHAEGYNTAANGDHSHAEGSGTTAGGEDSHAEGHSTEASGNDSHSEGKETIASGACSHVEGDNTKALGYSQHVQGAYNISDQDSVHIVGNGTSKKRSNAHTLDWKGNAWFSGDVYVGSTSGTNKDGGSKALATKEYVDNKILTKDTLPVDVIIEYEGTTIPTG